MRTPFYGACLMVAAMFIGIAVTYWTHPPTAVRAVFLVLALIVAVVGILMTLRDQP